MKQSRRIAAAIVKARAKKPIVTTGDLTEVVSPLISKEHEKKDLARLFQALRIEVNHEMDALRDMLLAATELLREGGRLSVITYHSLEDRIVKNVMKAGNVEGKVSQDFFGRIESPFILVNNKVITPSIEEQQENPRSRSAKLRIAEKQLDFQVDLDLGNKKPKWSQAFLFLFLYTCTLYSFFPGSLALHKCGFDTVNVYNS